MRAYVLSDLALDDLADIRHYIAAQNQAAGVRVIAGFFRRFQLLAEHPELGTLRPDLASEDLRVHSVGNYLIVYRLAGSNVEIARVLHGARDWDVLLR